MQSIDPAVAGEQAQTTQRLVNELIEVAGLDAVGGTILYMRARLV
jgi:hypothetical protein